MTEVKGPVTSSYIDSMCVLLPALLACCRSRADFVLCLFRMAAITIIEATTLIIKAVARELVDIMKAMIRFFVGRRVLVFTLIGSLALPVIVPQTMVCIANVHTLPSAGTSVQVILVWLVVVGQLPQFDARML